MWLWCEWEKKWKTKRKRTCDVDMWYDIDQVRWVCVCVVEQGVKKWEGKGKMEKLKAKKEGKNWMEKGSWVNGKGCFRHKFTGIALLRKQSVNPWLMKNQMKGGKKRGGLLIIDWKEEEKLKRGVSLR